MVGIDTLFLKVESERFDDQLDAAAEILRSGGLVAVPTETVYGLAANAFDESAVAKIFEAKGRPADNPLIVHVADMDGIPPLVREFPEKARRLLETFAPGPITVVLPKSEKISALVSAGLSSVAVRIPAHPMVRELIRRTGFPLAAPSANISGRPSPTTAQAVLQDLSGKIPAVLDGGSCAVGIESTVVSFCGPKPCLLRPGGVTVRQLGQILKEIEIHSSVLSQPDFLEEAASPGMKYRHYAPKTRLIVVRGSLRKFIGYVNARAGEPVAALCFEGEEPKLRVPCVAYGKQYDGEDQSRRLFESLRALDELDVKTAYARCPLPRGMGLAVYNRLIRAAAFEVLDLRHNPMIIGLTGPTGSGKSALAAELAKQPGFAHINADATSRKVMEKGAPLLDILADTFGGDILTSCGELNRKTLAARAFAGQESADLLNSITHPAILEEIRKEMDFLIESGAKYVIMDAPLLFESGADRFCDLTVALTAEDPVRFSRIKERDSMDEETALRRMNIQKKIEYYDSRADYTLKSDSRGISELAYQILQYIG